jgi:hypothetical protein
MPASGSHPSIQQALGLQAFDTLFNKRGYEAGRAFVRIDTYSTAPISLLAAEGDYVIGYGRFSGIGRHAAWIATDIVRIEDGKLAEHWDVIQNEATQTESKKRAADVW